MEILQFLLSFFSQELNGGKFAPLFELFRDNSFDLKKIIKNLNPEIIAPLVQEFMNFSKNNNPTATVGQTVGLSPIANIADKEIVYSLNKYFNN